ncbi:hypothetical protein RhiJN_06372 [Ceratobasidium sp. AG-Ba]|nr:hypothetical protein RhiJN_06372 [Ceratobasidium sp. AG-Ba]
MSVSDMAPLLPLSSAESESTVAIPAPTIAAVSPSPEESEDYRKPTNLADAENPRWSWLGVSRSFQQSWFLNWAVSITVQVIVTICLSRCYAHRSQQVKASDNDLMVEDILYILDEFGLSPRQLWNYIKEEGQTGLEASRAREPRPLNGAEPPVTAVVERDRE